MTTKIAFGQLQDGDLCERNGRTYRKIQGCSLKSGRAKFVAGCDPHLVGKTCAFAVTTKVQPINQIRK